MTWVLRRKRGSRPGHFRAFSLPVMDLVLLTAVVVANVTIAFAQRPVLGGNAEGEVLREVLDQYDAAIEQRREAVDRTDSRRRWLQRITDALEKEPESRWRRNAQFVRLTLANGIGDYGLSSSIADELRTTAQNLSDRISCTLQGGHANHSRFLVTREKEFATAAVARFADARRMRMDDSISPSDREALSFLLVDFIIANVRHAELLSVVMNQHGAAAGLLIEADGMFEQSKGEPRALLEETSYDRELFLSRAAAEYGRLRQMDRAEQLLARLGTLATLREPLDRHFLRSLELAYPGGGDEYQARSAAWIASSPPGPIRYELLYRLGNNQAATLKLDEATRTFRRLVANYNGEAATDQHVRHYVSEACHSLGWVLLRGAESAPYRKRFVELAQPDDVRLQRLRDQ